MIRVVADRGKRVWVNFSQSLGYLPGLIVAAFALLGIGLVELDGHVDLEGNSLIFAGDGSAARTVLSVVAGSLITVAGLTFSITMVVLQLASSQFSPRTLRTFFGDRITQVTIGSFVGIFVYSILVLRAVGSFSDPGFVPRLSITVASLLGIAAVVLLIVFLHHVSQMIQVSHITGRIARDSLARIDHLYPDSFGVGVDSGAADEELTRWRRDPSAPVHAARPGYVQRVDTDDLGHDLGERVTRLRFLVCPGDFVSVDEPIAEIWPTDAADACADRVRESVAVTDERDLDQDVAFGIRQLADTAIKAMSPGINDPMTAVTCIGYLRSLLVRLAGRDDLQPLLRGDEDGVGIMVRRRGFDEYLEPMLQINRYSAGDAWVAGELLGSLAAAMASARRAGAQERVRMIAEVAATVGEQAAREAASSHDAALIAERMEIFGGAESRE